jgi:signal transduction histidine kinase
VVFTARAVDSSDSLWLRSMGSETVRELPGTEGVGQFVSVKYTHNNGYVQVFSEIREINKRKFSVIGVKDNGVGIPANKQNKIFNIEDNYTTNGTGKEKGTGLGLILCKEFVEKHNGRIWCESQENQGSTFYFSLPFN